jgi:hypothetical protein
MIETESRFNNNKIRKSKKKHCIEEYKAKENRVTCVCGTFTGTEAEFKSHLGKDAYRPQPLDYLLELPKARDDYPINGFLSSHKTYGE